MITNFNLSALNLQPVKSYSYGGEISKGGYSKILQAYKDNKKYAVKCLTFQLSHHNAVGAVWLKEADFLSRCDHEALLKPVDIFYGSPFDKPLPERFGKFDEIHVVTTLAITDLYLYLRQYAKEVVPSHLKRMLFQISQGIEYLHHMDVCHRDIKSSNILIFSDPDIKNLRNAKLCDFGMCKAITSDHINSGHVSTGCYKPPELIMGNGYYGKAIDIWSLGIVFFEAFNMKYTFDITKTKGKQVNDLQVLEVIFKNRGCPTQEAFKFLCDGGSSPIAFKKIKGFKKQPISTLFDMTQQVLINFHEHVDPVRNFGTLDQYTDLLENMLEIDPRQRFTISQVLNHPFFSEIPAHDSPKIPITEDKWMGLRKQLLPKRTFHSLEKIKDNELRLKGFDVFASIPTDIPTCPSFEFSMWRIVFLGIDIYDRTLKVGSKDANFIALASGYIACKYFMDEATPKLVDLFPNYNIADVDELIKLEKYILVEVLKWQIYRPTIYDLLKKKVSPITLFDIMKKDVFYQGHTIDFLAELYHEDITSN